MVINVNGENYPYMVSFKRLTISNHNSYSRASKFNNQTHKSSILIKKIMSLPSKSIPNGGQNFFTELSYKLYFFQTNYSDHLHWWTEFHGQTHTQAVLQFSKQLTRNIPNSLGEHHFIGELTYYFSKQA